MKIFYPICCCFLLWSCIQTDDFEIPAINAIQGIEPKMTLTEFLDKYGNVEFPTYIANNQAVFTAYVVSSAQEGNMPFTISVQEKIDGGPGLKIPTDRFNYSGFYPVGQKIIINANRLFVGKLNSTLTLGSGQGNFWSIIDAMRPQHIIKTNERVRDSVLTPNEIKQSLPQNTVYLLPKKRTISEIKNTTEKHIVGTLIKLENVSFSSIYYGQTFLDGEDARNIQLEDGNGDFIDFRIESSSNFGKLLIPNGEGTVVAVLDRFNDDFQLRIRDIRDISFVSLPKIGFTTTELNLDEGSASFSLEIRLDEATDIPFTANLVLSSGDSSLLDDFTIKTLSFTGNLGETKSETINIPLDVDGNQNFVFRLEGISKADIVKVDASKSIFTLNVLDKNAPIKEAIIIFNEYIAGSSNNKYLEIKNIGNGDADLSLYKIELINNQNTTPSRTQILSEVAGAPLILQENEILVLKNSNANLVLPLGTVAYNSSVVAFNGDDALVLKNNNIAIDQLGTIGSGQLWSVAGVANASQGKGIRRKNSVLSGTTNWLDSAGTNAQNSQWTVVSSIDDATDLGK